MPAPLQAGDLVLLVDGRGRRYLVTLQEGGEFHYHLGVVSHGLMLGREEGCSVESTGGGRLLVLRPRLVDYVLKMKRGAQVVYPKDLGPIVLFADVGPGMTVVEAGTGSGALTLALLRAVGPAGRVVSVERREDHAAVGRRSVERWAGAVPDNLDLRLGDVEPVIAELGPARIVLDLPEPWHAAEVAARHQPGGGVFCAYLPTVPQVQTLVEAMREGDYTMVEVFETLHRTWNVDGRSVRPDHRMVGHTGFIVVGRKTSTKDKS
jgi:tRNA (adenine57-N1/adenine58-N1)-methyltransferase